MDPALRAFIIFAGGLFLGVIAFLLVGDVPPGDAAVPVRTIPLSSTTAPPMTDTPMSTSTRAERGALVIHGAGDVNTDVSYIPALAANGHGHAWSGLQGLFLEDDLTIVNLECNPSRMGEPLDKEFVFRCDIESLPVMREAGVEVVNLANNHSGDYGPAALLDGRANLEEAGLTPVGVGRNAEEAANPAVFDVRGWRVAVLGFGGVVPSHRWLATEDRPGMANGDDIETMVESVAAAAAVADLVVVTVHWGVERDPEPRPGDRDRAEAMIRAGADVILGHHPHRLQPLEILEGAPVAWSLGNFVWPDLSERASTTAVARVEVSPDGNVEACLISAHISSPGRPELRADPPC